MYQMKKLFASILCATIITSCSNVDNEILIEQSQTNSDLVTKSIVDSDTTDVLIITDDIWKQLMSSEGEFSNNENYKNPVTTRGYVDSRTVESYHSCKPRSGKENMKHLFTSDFLENLGLPTGIYIVDFCEAKVTLYTGEGEIFMYTDVSPNCGFKPDNGESRGYAMTINGNTVVLTTYLTHIKYDMLGRTIDKWWPVKPNNLIWNYQIYIPHWN